MKRLALSVGLALILALGWTVHGGGIQTVKACTPDWQYAHKIDADSPIIRYGRWTRTEIQIADDRGCDQVFFRSAQYALPAPTYFPDWIYAAIYVEQQDYNGQWHFVDAADQLWQDGQHDLATNLSIDLAGTGCLNPPCYIALAWSIANGSTPNYIYDHLASPTSWNCSPRFGITYDFRTDVWAVYPSGMCGSSSTGGAWFISGY